MNNGYLSQTLLALLALGMVLSVTGAADALAGNYTITATGSEGGTIEPSGLIEVAAGADQTFIMTPDPNQLDCWGSGKRYVVWNVTVDGQVAGPDPLASSQPVFYNFTDVQEDHTIHAEFTYALINARPTAKFTADPTSGPVPLTVNFSQVQVSNNTGVLWSFGDNTTSTEPNPVHTYTSAGLYDVAFTIFCNNSSFSDPPLPITVLAHPVPNGTLYVASSPTNATILVDGTDYGRTTKFVTVPSGTRNLTLIKDGYQPYTTVVSVPAGSVKVLAPVTLTKGGGPVPPAGTGTLYVASHPTNATILINGTDFGRTDRFVTDVPAGNRNLTLTRDGYQPYTTVVTVQAGEVKVLPPVELVPVPDGKEKIAAFIAALQREGFTVQQGKLEKFDIMAMYNAGLIPGCFGNNPSTPYLVYKLPPYPGLVIGGRITDAPINPANAGLWLDYFMEPDEAIVYVGPTPPEVKYFSYRSYISSRWFPEQNTSEHIFASLGDQINNFRINTGTSSGDTSPGPYNKQVMIITTADRGTEELVRNAALTSGYQTNMMNDDIIPSGLIRMGKENTSDAITVIHRVALFANETLGSEYVNSTPGTVLRLTPNTSNVPQPYGVPPLIVRGTGDTHELDLLQDQEALRESIIAREGVGMVITENKSSIYVLEGYDSLQREINAQGDNRDTIYLSNGNYTLSDNEFIIIYGVNHQKTGKATYTNAAVYGAEALNGVAAVTDSEYAGSADSYLPGNKDSGLFYVWKFARHCNGEAGCTEVPSCCGGAGIPEDAPVMIGFRAYVEPETGIGPSWTEVLYDQVIHFAPA
jgi:PKD repeat protein